MNQDRIAGVWKQLKGRVRSRWGSATNDSLAMLAGAQEQLAGRIQARYGASKDRYAAQLKEFFDRNREWNASDR